MKRYAIMLAGLLALFGAAAPASAAGPAAVITRLGQEGTAVIGPNVSQAVRQARFRQLLDEDFDTAAIARFALGSYWRLASPTQRAAFTRLFADFIAAIYANRLGDYQGARLVVAGVRNGDDGTLVQSKLERSNGKPVEIDWRMSPEGDSWKVVDALIDGVSMTATLRNEVAPVVERLGGRIEALLAAMRAKVGTIPGSALAGQTPASPPPVVYSGSSRPPAGYPPR